MVFLFYVTALAVKTPMTAVFVLAWLLNQPTAGGSKIIHVLEFVVWGGENGGGKKVPPRDQDGGALLFVGHSLVV